MNIGLIGTGNMGAAIIKGYVGGDPSRAKKFYAYDQDQTKLLALSEETGIHGCRDAMDVAVKSDILIMAVKPNVFEEALKEILPVENLKDKILVSIAAGISISRMEHFCRDLSGAKEKKQPFSCKVVRVMPNTPALVGQGMSALCRNEGVTDKEFETVLDLFASLGKAEEVNEKLMDSVVGISGSSPAYVYLFIEALADGACEQGMARDQAYRFAAQTVLGSAQMVLSTGKHPGELKDMVCSPGGTTIEAVASLEKNGFRNAVIEAVKTAAKKSEAMGK